MARLLPIALLLLLLLSPARAEDVHLSSLDLTHVSQGWGEAEADRSVDGAPLKIGGRSFDRGIGTHAPGAIRVRLDGAATRFTAFAGVDDEAAGTDGGTVRFHVFADGRSVWESGVVRGGEAAKPIDLDVTGVQELLLLLAATDDGMTWDHADWADARVTLVPGGAPPRIVGAPAEERIVLTPKPGPAPRVNGPRIFGVRPGRPFLYTVPATGERPMAFAADGLPEGLTLDADTGRITGEVAERGEHAVTLRATNAHGASERPFRIVVGDRIALTPPMGWNSWNCFGAAVDDAKIRAAADAMVKSGLVNHGWTYINIDDGWQVKPETNDPALGGDLREADGTIRTNAHFPDMHALAEYVHAQGLKFGIYSSPGPLTCAGYAGSYEHELQDAQQYAAWGVDYLKHDWCSYGRIAPDPDLAAMQKPYGVMRAALDQVDRDIVYSLCQYGMGSVWQWGDQVGGNLWRTTGDITDTWDSMSSIGFAQAGKEAFAKPGAWNDPDMLVVGQVGWGPRLRPTRLTPNEQYTHITLWSLLGAPLLIGCDLSQLDDFTLGLLTNDEVIDVNQDPLGKQAARVASTGWTEVWVKELGDGSKAVGLFNRGEMATTVAAEWPALGVSGEQVVRDVWRQQDLGTFSDRYEAEVPRHGAVFLRLTPAP